jgi:hypothetical protein
MRNQSADIIARQLLETLAQLNSVFRDHEIKYRKLEHVSGVTKYLEVIEYEDGPQIEGSVDVELQDGNVISWILEVTWNKDEWIIAANRKASIVDGQFVDGQKVVAELPTQIITRFDDFLRKVILTAHDLFALQSASFDRPEP